MMRGDNVGKVYTFAEQAEINTAPGQRGEACKPYVRRLDAALRELGISLGKISYFDNPTAFVISAAAMHNRRDRLNEALDQVESLQRRIGKLREELED